MKKNVDAKILWSCIFLGVMLRFVLMSLGHNFDFDSYCIVGELASQGKNIYASTTRYNYSFIWFSVLGIFWKISLCFTDNIQVFRILIVSTLTISDFLIALIISRKAGNFWGIIFFLNPISLIITGYHNQFDNIAVLLGAYGILCISLSMNDSRITAQDIAGIILLSLSLITKHILWAFPLWILFNQKISARKKILFAFVPPLIFLLSFAPYWHEGWHGIIRNVFLYRSFNNFPLIALPVLNYFGIHLPFQNQICLPLFGLLMIGSAYIFRDKDIFDSFMLYTMALVSFSSAIANQYIAIPCMAAVIMMKRRSALYFIIGLIYLSCNINGLHIPAFLHEHYGVPFNIVTKILSSGGIMYSLFSWCLLAYLFYHYRYKNQRVL